MVLKYHLRLQVLQVVRSVDPVARLYQQRADALRKRSVAHAVARWNALPDWSRKSNDAYARHMAEYSTQAQRALLHLLTAMVSQMSGSKVTLDPDKLTGDAIRDGDIEEHWRIPMYAAWKALGEGTPPSGAG